MSSKHKLSGIRIIAEFEGSTKTVYGRCDEYPTRSEFMKAAKKYVDHEEDGYYKVQNPRKCWLRVNVADPNLQEEFGCLYLICEVPGGGRQGRWQSWVAEMEYTEDDVR